MLSTYDNAVAARPNGFNAGGLRLPVRPRLLERLGEAGTVPGSQRLTVLCASSGYGKTATVAAWLDGGDPR